MSTPDVSTTTPASVNNSTEEVKSGEGGVEAGIKRSIEDSTTNGGGNGQHNNNNNNGNHNKKPKTDDNANNVTAKKRSSKYKKRNKIDPNLLAFRKTIQKCCATNDLPRAMVAFEDALASQVQIEAQSFYSLLNLCGGLSTTSRRGGIHIGTPRTTHKNGSGGKDAAHDDHNNKCNGKTSENGEVGAPVTSADEDQEMMDETPCRIKVEMDAPNDASIDDIEKSNENSSDDGEVQDKSNQKMDEVHEEAEQKQKLSAVKEEPDQEWSQKLSEANEQSSQKPSEANEESSQKLPVKVEVDAQKRVEYAERVKHFMDTQSLPLTESAYSALVKLYCNVGNVEQAEKLLAQAEQCQQCKPKLRLYSSLLATYCRNRNLMAALRTWRRLTTQQALLPSEKEYIALLQCATAEGSVAVLERVLSDLAEDVLVPCRTTRQVLCEWFQSPHAVAGAESEDSESKGKKDELLALLSEIQLPYAEQAPNMGPVQCAKDHTWEISHDVKVDTATGKLMSGCLEGATLQPIALSTQAWNTMKQMNVNIASTGKLDEDKSEFQGGSKGPKQPVAPGSLDERKNHWNAYLGYLERRCSHRKIDIVIDGANVGYYEQNFEGAPKHVDYEQIEWIVHHFLSRPNPPSVLLILHSRHFSRHLMPKSAERLHRKWLDHGILYRTPPGMNDDWFWLQAALASGPGTLVVTNDEMRDHHFQMLSQRSFLRWKDRHQVHFTFGGFDRATKQRAVKLTYPDPYSRRIQRVENGLVVPLAKRGDENRFLDGSFVANESDVPEEETYLCIRPKLVKTES